MKFFRTSLLISTSLLIIGLLFKIMHWPGAGIMMGVAWLSAISFAFIGLQAIYKSSNALIEKFLWLIGFVFLPWIAGYLYYFVEVRPKYK